MRLGVITAVGNRKEERRITRRQRGEREKEGDSEIESEREEK